MPLEENEMKQLPKDPVMRLSWLNTQLRDFYPSLEELCTDQDISETELRESMKATGFCYVQEINQFR